MKEGYLAGFGEVMLRLCPPERKRFAQALPGQLEATFGGGEANVCASLAMLGAKSRYLTALPENPVSAAFATQLRGLKVDVDHIHYTKSGRMGVYYAEHGAAQRGSNVVYDRENSVISLLGPEAYDFPAMLENVAHLHITGITPSLSENAYRTTLELVKYASSQGINISCDLNFRKKLWKWRPGSAPRELAAECMGKIVPYVNWIICNEEDASDVFGIASESSSIEEGKIDAEGYCGVARRLLERFPKAEYVAITLRESYSANHNNWGAMLYSRAEGRAFFDDLCVKIEKSRKSQPAEVRYVTHAVRRTTLERTTVLTGTVEPRDEVLIKPQISGIISELYKEAGELVKQGDLVVLNTDNYHFLTYYIGMNCVYTTIKEGVIYPNA